MNSVNRLLNTSNDSTEWDEKVAYLLSDYAFVFHVVRAVVSCLAVVSNLTVILLFACRPKLQSKINWTVCNLMLSNGTFAFFIGLFSMMKATHSRALSAQTGCLTLTWVIIFCSFGPSWAVLLMAVTRATTFSSHLHQLLSLRHLFIARVAILTCDIILTSLIVYDIRLLTDHTQCTYQLMLDNSYLYVFYSLALILMLVSAVIWSFVARTKYRWMRLKQIQRVDQRATRAEAGKSALEIPIPSSVFTNPKLIIIAITLSVLFMLPRIAFVCHSREMWAVSTISPVVLAFAIPPSFLYFLKDFRKEMVTVVKNNVITDLICRRI